MSFESCVRRLNYLYDRTGEVISAPLALARSELQKPEARTLRVALAVFALCGSLLVGCVLSWKWIVALCAVHTLLEMNPIDWSAKENWQKMLRPGLHLGLVIRATKLVLQGLFLSAPISFLEGVFIGGSLFFKADWDQCDWAPTTSNPPLALSTFHQPKPALAPCLDSSTTSREGAVSLLPLTPASVGELEPALLSTSESEGTFTPEEGLEAMEDSDGGEQNTPYSTFQKKVRFAPSVTILDRHVKLLCESRPQLESPT